ncbi:glycoside hydrolase [Xylariomycetidae sp. FL2044]|nr:glycoside hydrolase [Xylariomycetidae sp. FL2044]
MALSYTIATLAATALLPMVQGHFTFARISVNGEWQEPGRYFRNKTDPFAEPATQDEAHYTFYNNPTFPQHLPTSVRCGRDSLAHAAATEVLTVRAGDALEFAHTKFAPAEWRDEQWYGCPEGRGSCAPGSTLSSSPFMEFPHPGPVLAHLSRVPDGLGVGVREYEGDGAWLKIYTLGYEFDGGPDRTVWLAHNKTGIPGRITFNLPAQTPAGEYLLRIDQIWAYYRDVVPPRGGYTQLYPSCVQIRVESDVVGELPSEGGVKIPEVFCTECPGMKTGVGMYTGMGAPDEDYVFPGGPQWDGEEVSVVQPPTWSAE